MSEFQIHQEGIFEDAITNHLIENGWAAGDKAGFDAETAIDKSAVIAFIKESQEAKWKKFIEFYKTDAEKQFLYRLGKELELRGMLDVIRHGIDDSGIKFQLAYFKPDSGLNPETIALYKTNKLYATRQVRFQKGTNECVDLLLSLNGLPLATLELKNHLTGQRVADAIKQYRFDRDPNTPLFQFRK